MQAEEVFVFVFVVGMFAGVLIVFLALRQRSQLLEMRHRERMAMIERGQIPLSEPSASVPAGHRLRPGHEPSTRSLSIGIIVVGLGLSLMTIIGIAGESPEVGVGIGGAIAILGGAFIIRSLVVPSVARQAVHSAPPAAKTDDEI